MEKDHTKQVREQGHGSWIWEVQFLLQEFGDAVRHVRL